MNRRLLYRLGIAAIALLFLGFSVLNSRLLGSVRLDLTEGGLYSVSDGTRRVLEGVGQPVTLQLFFSDQQSKSVPALRAYAGRVRALLAEYVLLSGGRLKLEEIDPAPFSEAEDRAAEYGLHAVPLPGGGGQLYFGLAAGDGAGNRETIPFFAPEHEHFLEYDITRMIYKLSQPRRPRLGLISGLPMQGGLDLRTGQAGRLWAIVEQLQQLYELVPVEAEATSLPQHLDALMVVHPVALDEALLYSIDQYAMRGGKIMLFVDRLSEAANSGGVLGSVITESDFDGMLKAWGVELLKDKVLGDAAAAMLVPQEIEGPMQHLCYLNLNPGNMAIQEVTVAGLESINLGSAGILRPLPGAASTFEPLLYSSRYAMPMDRAHVEKTLRDPAALQRNFRATGEQYVIAARLAGRATSAFGAAPDGRDPASHRAGTAALNVLVVADTDILSDRLWVQEPGEFGQMPRVAWADNGGFVLNAADHMIGADVLMGIRSRGRFAREFTVVQALRTEAQSLYQQTAERLQASLDETDRRLIELQQGDAGSAAAAISPDLQGTLEQLQREKLELRKQLREVRHKLDRDIEALGRTLELLNIAVAPVLMTLLLYVLYRAHVRWQRKRW